MGLYCSVCIYLMEWAWLSVLHLHRVHAASIAVCPYMEVAMNIDWLFKFVQASMEPYCSVCTLWSGRGLYIKAGLSL